MNEVGKAWLANEKDSVSDIKTVIRTSGFEYSAARMTSTYSISRPNILTTFN